MYTGGKRRLYLELPSWQYLPLPPHFQKVRKITIYFYFKKCSNFKKNISRFHNSRNVEGYSRNRGRCNGSCRRKSSFCHTHVLICSNFYNNPARNSCSCFPTLSCPYSSICHIFSWSGARRCPWFKRSWSFDRIYTVRHLFPLSLLLPFTLTRFDLDILGVPHSTYYLDWQPSSLLVVCFR